MPSTTSTASATLLFLDLPPKTFVGLDLISFTSSPSFRGITSVPSGFHLVYSGTDASLAIRHGNWFLIPQDTPPGSHRTIVCQWDVKSERLRLTDETSNNDSRIALSQLSISASPASGLLDYRQLQDATAELSASQPSPNSSSRAPETEPSPVSADWPLLTSHLSTPLLSRVLGPRAWHISSVSSAAQDAESIPGLTRAEAASVLGGGGGGGGGDGDEEEKALAFLAVDLKRTWRDGALGRERTEQARDRSWYLRRVIESASGNDTAGATANDEQQQRQLAVGAREVLGELQLCFVAVLTLANYSALAQWKRLVGVLLTCGAALGEIEEFFVEAVRVLRLQMAHCDDVDGGGLFDFESGDATMWLRVLLKQFKRSVDDVLAGRGRLAEELSELEDLLRETYGWEVEGALLKRGMLDLEDGERVEMDMAGADEEDEEGEYAPVVVEEENG